MVYTPVISIAPPLAFLMLIWYPVHFFSTLPCWRACLNVCDVINVSDAPVSYKKRCLCVLPKFRYAHDLLRFFFQTFFYQRSLKMQRCQIHLTHHTYGRMGLLPLPFSVGKILRGVLLPTCGIVIGAFPTVQGCVALFPAPLA
jgi:hypothetical protein